MGQRKRSDVNRAANFTQGDEDRPTKRSKFASGKENLPPTAYQMEEQLTERHLDVREMSESPAKNLVGGMKTRFRLERDNLAGTGPRDSDMLGHSFHKFQIPTKDSNDLGNLLNMETIKETC